MVKLGRGPPLPVVGSSNPVAERRADWSAFHRYFVFPLSEVEVYPVASHSSCLLAEEPMDLTVLRSFCPVSMVKNEMG